MLYIKNWGEVDKSRYYFSDKVYGNRLHPVRQMFLISFVADYIKRTGRDNLKVLEIGSYCGSSAVSMAIMIEKFGKEYQIFAIDPWESGSPNEVNFKIKIMNLFLEHGVIYDIFLHNIKSHYIIPIKGKSQDILPCLASGMFDIVFIDGDHRYEQVKKDIKNVKRLIKNDGLIIGDDFEMSWEDCDESYYNNLLNYECIKMQNREKNFHPGVSKAVYEELRITDNFGGLWASYGDGTKPTAEKMTWYEPIFMEGKEFLLAQFLKDKIKSGRE